MPGLGRMEEPERGQYGPPARVCPADDRRARRAVCAPVVHRRRGIAQVRGAGPGRGGRRLRGRTRIRRFLDRRPGPRLRIRHAGPAGSGHVPDPAVARRDRGHIADVLRHPDPRRRTLRRGPAQRPQAHPGQGRGHGLHLLHPPRDRVLPAQVPGAGPGRITDPRGRGRLLRPRPGRRGPGLPPDRRDHARIGGHLGGIQPPRGRARARTKSTCATRTRCRPRTTS